MLRTLPLLVLFGLTVWAADSGPVRESSVPAIIGIVMPAFYNGYLYSTEPHHVLTLFAPDGHELFSLPLPGCGNGNVSVESVAVDSNGMLAIAWQDRPNAGIDIRELSGALVRSIDTGRYVPAHLSFGAHHELWAFGWQRDPEVPNRADKRDYPTVRKYSMDGKEIGAYLSKAFFDNGLPPGMSESQRRCITVTGDRVGIEAVSGKVSNQREWVELDLNGKITGRWKMNERDQFPGVAFTSDDQAYVHRYNRETNSIQTFRLNRAASTWDLVDAPNQELYGADGNKLVFARWSGNIMDLRWFPQP